MNEVLLYNKTIQITFREGNHSYLVNGKSGYPSVTGITGVIDKPGLKFWSANLCGEYVKEKVDGFNGKITPEVVKVWAEDGKKEHTKFKEKAADLGSQVHDFCEQYIKFSLGIVKEKPEITKNMDERVRNGILAFLQLVEEKDIKFIASEKIIFSKKHKFVGRLDLKFTIGGKEKHKILHMGDFKTGNPRELTHIEKGVKIVDGYEPWEEHRYQVSGYQGADIEESGDVFGSKYIFYLSKETGEFKDFECDDQEKDYKAFLSAKYLFDRAKEIKAK